MGVNPLVNTDIFNSVFRKQMKMAAYTHKLAGQITIAKEYPPILILDPDGSPRDVLLPVEADSKDLMFYIFNTAGGTPEILTIKDDSDTDTILSLDQAEVGLVYCDGTTWRGFSGFSTAITATVAELNYVDIAAVGTVEATKAIVVDSNKRLVWATTSSSTVDPLAFTSTMTGAGTTGGRALFRMNAEAALGGWSNALKAHVVYGATAKTTGLGSAFVAELQLSAGTVDGTYAPLEAEIVTSAGGSTGTSTSFLYMNVTDDSATFNTNGFLFELGAGVVDTANGLFDAESKTGIAKTHTLKIKIGGTPYYIALHTAQAMGGS